MTESRRMRILSALASGSHEPAGRLCEVAASTTGLTGAGIMIMSGDYPTGSICSTDAVSRLIEELQYDLGEGPCVDAYNAGSPVLSGDLAGDAARWPAFRPPAVAAGAKAVFGFPLVLGAVRVGALNLYRDRMGDLSDEQHADALVMADIAARAVLSMQAEAPPGDLAVGLDGGDLHLVVHQAAGMVSVQLDVSIGVALIRLRAWAFANDRTLEDVARKVVARQLRLDADGTRSG
jgi:hypothetical protein